MTTISQSRDSETLGGLFRWTPSQFLLSFEPKTWQTCLAKNVTFLNKSYGEWDKPISYHGSDKGEFEIVPEKNNTDNNYNVVSDFESDKKEEKKRGKVFKLKIDYELDLRPLQILKR